MPVTAGTILGTAILQSIDGETILCSTSATLTITNEEIETTCKDNDGAYTSAPGQQKWSIQIQGNIVYDNATGVRDLQELAANRNTVQVAFGVLDNPEDPVWTGDAFVSSLVLTGGQNSPATWDVTFSPRGPISLSNS